MKILDRKIACAFLSLGCSLFVSCGKTSEKSEVKIFGGQPTAEGQWLSAIAYGDGTGFFCTGVAAAPKLVITAAHCLKGKDPSIQTVLVGNGVEGGEIVNGNAVESSAVHPKYVGYGNGYDIGFLILKDPLPLPKEAYIKLANPAERENEGLEAVGRKVTILGYGARENSELGIKYEVETSIVSKVEDLGGITTHRPSNEFLAGGENHGVCGGDSGGPIYTQSKDGTWRVIGLTSRGWECGKATVFSSIASNLCWLQQESHVDLGVPDQDCPAPLGTTPLPYDPLDSW